MREAIYEFISTVAMHTNECKQNLFAYTFGRVSCTDNIYDVVLVNMHSTIVYKKVEGEKIQYCFECIVMTSPKQVFNSATFLGAFMKR